MTLDEALQRNAELGVQVQRFEEDLKVAQLTIARAARRLAAGDCRGGLTLRRQGGGSRYSAAMSTTSADNDLHAWQLYVELEDVRPKVWRRLLVPLTIDLSRLHVMLLWGTGWDGGHVHEFIFGQDHYGATEPGREFPDDLMPEEDVTLSQALGKRKSFKYLYDFGDCWWHKVKVEKIVRLEAPIEYAQCIGGENACPPEDVGGAPGYEEFLEALADPSHPEHEDQKEWIGRPFDPSVFDIDKINDRLNARE